MKKRQSKDKTDHEDTKTRRKTKQDTKPMETVSGSYELYPAGYLIVKIRDEQDLRRDDEYRRSTGQQSIGPYFGVDRGWFISANDTVRQMAGLELIKDKDLQAVMEEYEEATDSDFFPFFVNEEKALRVFQALLPFQDLLTFHPRLELLYCHVALREGEKDRIAAYAAIEGDAPAISRTYGFDVSWPGCNHSAIYQPGVVSVSATWRGKLNRFGLLDDYSDARRLREEYLAVCPGLPFDIFLVHSVA